MCFHFMGSSRLFCVFIQESCCSVRLLFCQGPQRAELILQCDIYRHLASDWSLRGKGRSRLERYTSLFLISSSMNMADVLQTHCGLRVTSTRLCVCLVRTCTKAWRQSVIIGLDQSHGFITSREICWDLFCYVVMKLEVLHRHDTIAIYECNFQVCS